MFKKFAILKTEVVGRPPDKEILVVVIYFPLVGLELFFRSF